MRTLHALIASAGAALLASACQPDPLCLSDRQCPERTTCFAGECIDRQVAGDPRALYTREFRLRLEVDCGQCHADGQREAGVTPGDGRWRLYTGATLDGARVEASWQDLVDFTAGMSAEATALVQFGRGAANHPVIWSAATPTVADERILSWLWLFEGRGERPDLAVVDMAPPVDGGPPGDVGPRPDGGPIDQGPRPDQGPVVGPPDRTVYAGAIDPRLQASCGPGCHQGNPIPNDGFFRLGPGAIPEAVAANYDDVQQFIDGANPAGSRLLQAATAQAPHPGGAVWAVGDDDFEAVRRWIAGEAP